MSKQVELIINGKKTLVKVRTAEDNESSSEDEDENEEFNDEENDDEEKLLRTRSSTTGVPSTSPQITFPSSNVSPHERKTLNLTHVSDNESPLSLHKIEPSSKVNSPIPSLPSSPNIVPRSKVSDETKSTPTSKSPIHSSSAFHQHSPTNIQQQIASQLLHVLSQPAQNSSSTYEEMSIEEPSKSSTVTTEGFSFGSYPSSSTMVSTGIHNVNTTSSSNKKKNVIEKESMGLHTKSHKLNEFIFRYRWRMLIVSLLFVLLLGASLYSSRVIIESVMQEDVDDSVIQITSLYPTIIQNDNIKFNFSAVYHFPFHYDATLVSNIWLSQNNVIIGQVEFPEVDTSEFNSEGSYSALAHGINLTPDGFPLFLSKFFNTGGGQKPSFMSLNGSFSFDFNTALVDTRKSLNFQSEVPFKGIKDDIVRRIRFSDFDFNNITKLASFYFSLRVYNPMQSSLVFRGYKLNVTYTKIRLPEAPVTIELGEVIDDGPHQILQLGEEGFKTQLIVVESEQLSADMYKDWRDGRLAVNIVEGEIWLGVGSQNVSVNFEVKKSSVLNV